MLCSQDINLLLTYMVPITVAARYKAWVYDRSLDEIMDSNPAGGMSVCLLWVLCVVRYRSLQRAGHSCVQLPVIEEPHTGDLGPLDLSSHQKNNIESELILIKSD